MNIGTVHSPSAIDVGGALLRIPSPRSEWARRCGEYAPERVFVSPMLNNTPKDGEDALLARRRRGRYGFRYDVFVTIADGVEVLARSWLRSTSRSAHGVRLHLTGRGITVEASSDRTGQARNHGATR